MCEMEPGCGEGGTSRRDVRRPVELCGAQSGEQRAEPVERRGATGERQSTVSDLLLQVFARV